MRVRFALPSLRVSGLAAGLALVLGAVLPAWGQVTPPPSRHGDDDNGRTPHYVDNADYDPQPYYVDGVQYKPYVKKARAADSAARPAAARVTQTEAVSSAAPGELHPFVPADAEASSSSASKAQAASSSRASARAVAEASSASSSSSAYVPQKRARYASAIIEALDKVTAESVRFEAPIGQPVRYKGLIYVIKACETTADDEPTPDVIAYMQVLTSPSTATNRAAAVDSKEIFHGWTFASAPSLNPIQHPVYDAWVIACRHPLAG